MPRKADITNAAYEKIKDEALRRRNEASKTARDISGDFPPPESINWERRNECWDDLKLFLETYFPETFHLRWSDDHLRIIAQLQTAIVTGGMFSMALPRGSGKTSMSERAAIWAILTGKRRFLTLIGATQEAADRLLSHIKTELQFNDRLHQDFPSACYPIQRIEGNAKRCNGQTYNGKQTLITWSNSKLVLPSIDREDSSCSSSIITTCGLTGGNIRGQNHVLPSGETIRPSLVLLDDPQTRESAASLSQTKRRLELLLGDVMGMAGPAQTISLVLTCTVIYQGDLSDTVLDRTKHPQFHGERCKLLYAFPTNEKLWDKYQIIQDESFRKDGDGSEATTFYQDNQETMDEGAIAQWAERFNENEISAIQHAMNLFFRDEQAFYSEYQNEPQTNAGDDVELAKPDQIVEKLNGLRKGNCPSDAQWVTCFIDIQKTMLFYTVCAFQPDFTCNVIDYGGFPDQKRNYFTLSNAKKTLQTIMPRAGLNGQIYFGLEQLVKSLVEKKYLDDAGTERHIDRLLIDANWGTSTSTVYKFCKESPHRRILMPSHGRYVGATSKPYSEYRKYKGDINGFHWRIPKPYRRGEVRHVNVDINYWKTFIFDCLNVAKGDAGALTLWGDKSHIHKMFADQLCGESCVRVSAHDRTIDEWRLLPHKPDNHFLDCLVGCFAAASICGAKVLAGSKLPKAADVDADGKKLNKKKNRVSYINM